MDEGAARVTLEYLSVFLMVVATAVMAASAAIQAKRHDLDLFGATVLAAAAALGGGTVRDMLLGRMPVFWIHDLTYIATIIPVAMASWFVATRMSAGNGRRLAWLMRFDAMGLALFTLVGVRVAVEAETSALIAVIIGCITGTVGGMIRDLLCNVTPIVLKQDLYATISLAGGALYLGLRAVAPEWAAVGVSFGAMLGTRLVVLERQAARA